MADYSDAVDSLPPVSQGKNQRLQSTVQGQQKQRRKQQQRAQHDGTVSDSVANPIPSPRSKKQPKQRQQSSPSGMARQNGNMSKTNGQKPLPVSMVADLVPATPAKEQAYAGPTFQASPAPSSLPVPRFFSKSVPNVAAKPAVAHRRFESQSAVEEHSSPETDTVIPVPSRDAAHSPLDLFFKADRAEKERSKSSGHMLSPDFSPTRPRPLMIEPQSKFPPSGKGVFLRELDGDSGDLPNPTVPHNNRPQPVERAHSSSAVPNSSMAEQQRNEAYTQSLKDILFNGVNAAPQSTRTPPHSRQNCAQSQPSPFYGTPSPSQRAASDPTTPLPNPSSEQDQYSLHYGNRKNLSPLFKAARDETPPRPSSLRQEVHSDTASNIDSAVDFQPQHSRKLAQHLNVNAFSRQYLDHHIQTGQQRPRQQQLQQGPPIPSMNSRGNGSGYDSGSVSDSGTAHRVSVNSPHNPRNQNQHNHNHNQQVPPSPFFGSAEGPAPPSSISSPRTAAPAPEYRDLGAMSDDLRKMLNLNVLG